ncbi:hypothetical protein ABFX02_08G200600 [Erythranthe guttata]
MNKNIQTMVDHWLKLLICLVVSMSARVTSTEIDNVTITILDNAVARGAVCLDGGPPAYYFSKGFGDGVNNWLIDLQGGGWCNTPEGCAYRSNHDTGSSKYKTTTARFGGMKSANQTKNPEFYNWNIINVGYCDCSSYKGDVEAADPTTNVTRRGARIFDFVMEDLLAKGMANAENAILTGGSAGGLGAILHCDDFRSLLPNTKRVKCISDSGVFLHAKDLPGADQRAEYFAKMVAYHGVTKSLPSPCTSRMNCVFPEYIVRDIETPIFFIESAFDPYQLIHHYFSNESTWENCTANLEVCTPSQLQTMKDYGITLRKTLQEFGVCKPKSVGMFVHSCYRHGNWYDDLTWTRSALLGNKTIAQAVGDWFFDRSSFQEIDYENELPRSFDCSKATAPCSSIY